MNLVVLKGNLTRDPEVRQTSGGNSVTNCAIAVNRRVKRGDNWVDEATFVEFSIWGSRGEAFAKYHKKGSAALLSQGRLQLDQWEDKQSGEKRSKLKVVVNEWEFVGGSKSEGEPAQSHSSIADDDVPF